MTLKEYDARMDEYSIELRANYTEELYEKVSEFQDTNMRKFLAEYKEKINGDEAKQVCYELLEYAITDSESGSSVEYVETKELADKIKEIIDDELGDYLLDSPEIYDCKDGTYAIDCMFAGNYVPYWDGWK